MKRSTASLIALVLALAPVLSAALYAQAGTHDPTQLDLLEGRIVRIDSEKMTFEMRQSGPSGVTWTVAWNDKTAFTYRNEASSLDDLKDGRRVICLGTFGESNRMEARRVDVRDKSGD
ncbi:MAG: hypothetical protein LJF30_15180 [Acidobacteria bacterium]|jgi:hypothetical protein|nr:hypothetical protein [Acidobacteriota bacterium]